MSCRTEGTYDQSSDRTVVSRIVLLLVLVVLAGCVGTPAGDTPTPTNSPTPTATPDPPNETARNQAIAAEKDRIRTALDGRENLTGLGFGILRPAEAEVTERNATGAFVDVMVGYSFTIENCGSYDGATTETRYFVSPDRTRLIDVEQDYTDRRGC